MPAVGHGVEGKQMAITSADIHNQSFSIDRKGYDVDEVDVFLEHIANEVDDLNAIIEQLENELENSEFTNYEAPAPAPRETGIAPEELAKRDAQIADKDAQIANKDAKIADLEKQLEEKNANDYAIAQALIIAQRSSDEMIAIAQEDAAKIRQDAEDEGQRIIDKAIREKQDVINDIEKLDDDREDARNEYQAILKDFISDASKKLSDLTSSGIPPARAGAKAAAAKADRTATSKHQAPIRPAANAAQTAYTTPQAASPSVVVPVTPKPSKVEKDLSGFGDAADSFEFGEID